MRSGIALIFVLFPLWLQAQQAITRSHNINTITTAVPFLLINDDARSSGMGEIGVVSAPQYYRSSQNPALISRNRKISTLSFSYIPWSRAFIPGTNLFSLQGNFAIDSSNAVAYDFVWFSLGEIQFTSATGQPLYTVQPIEFSQSLKYAHSFGENFSAGIAAKYIFSDLLYGAHQAFSFYKPVRSYAFDLGADYRKSFALDEQKTMRINAALALLNLGPKVSYGGNRQDFIPSDLKAGVMATVKQKVGKNAFGYLDMAYQAEKLLVPTPPAYGIDSTGNLIRDQDGNPVVVAGVDSRNMSAFQGMLSSFTDAPGGSREEMAEIIHMIGSEARVVMDEKMLFAFRAGRFMESLSKGNRNYNTFGITIGYFGAHADVSYLLAPRLQRPLSPLSNTIKISAGIQMNFGDADPFRFSF